MAIIYLDFRQFTIITLCKPFLLLNSSVTVNIYRKNNTMEIICPCVYSCLLHGKFPCINY